MTPTATDTQPAKVTARDIRAALDKRYGTRSQGREAEAWVTIPEARSGAGFGGGDGQCDYLAINTWTSRGLQVIGHEIKVSLADWKAEIAKPDKAERFARFCRRWWVVVPTELAAKIRHDVPPAWGLLAISDKLTCREVIAAPSREPEPIPAWWWIGWLAQVDRGHKRADAAELQRLVNQAVEQRRPLIEKSAVRSLDHTREELRVTHEKIRLFAKATGVDVRHAWPHDIERLAQVYAAVKRSTDFAGIANQMRRAVEALDALTEVEA